MNGIYEYDNIAPPSSVQEPFPATEPHPQVDGIVMSQT